MITADEKSHNTTVLGKYLPRKKTFWQLEPGLPSVNMNASRVLINFEYVSHAYLFVTIWLCVSWILFVCLMDFPLVFFEPIIESIYENEYVALIVYECNNNAWMKYDVKKKQ